MKGEYHILGTIRKGSEGDVRLCQTKGGAEMAVKIIDVLTNSEAIQRHTDATMFCSKGLIKIYDIYVENGLCYIVMEKGEQDLMDLIETSDADFDEAQMKTLFTPLFEALKEIHSNGYVHGDIKPDNILVLADGTLKICDFGHLEKLTNGCSVVKCGSPFYLAPELIRNRPHNQKVDVYALGMTMYAYIAKVFPYGGDYYEYCCRACLEDADTAPLAEIVSDDLVTLISAMLCRNPEKRPTIAECLTSPWFA